MQSKAAISARNPIMSLYLIGFATVFNGIAALMPYPGPGVVTVAGPEPVLLL